MGKFNIKNLELYYGDFHALKNVNLDIPEKEITAFIGPSGCGKSTLLKAIAGIFSPDSGTIIPIAVSWDSPISCSLFSMRNGFSFEPFPWVPSKNSKLDFPFHSLQMSPSELV